MRLVFFLILFKCSYCLDCPFGDSLYKNLDYSTIFENTRTYDDIDCNCMKALYKGSGITRYESLMDAKSFHSMLDWQYYKIYDIYFPNVFPMKSKIWLGITCADNNPSNCTLDNGDRLPQNVIQDFAQGHPNVTIGPYVFASTFNGTTLLYSSSNKAALNGYVMRYSSDNTNCPTGFSGYKDMCFFASKASGNFTFAQNYCKNLGAQLATITSDDYNNIIKNMLDQTFYIGFMQKSTTWLDGSAISFLNFGFSDRALGECVVVNRDTLSSTGNLMPGEWSYASCSDTFNFACSTPRLAESNFIKTKDVCIEPIFISVNSSGTLFPSGNQTTLMNTCTYILIAPIGRTIEAQTQFEGDQADLRHIIHLTLYNDATNYDRYLQYNAQMHPEGVFRSKANSMRIVFDTNGSSFNYKWQINYSLV